VWLELAALPDAVPLLPLPNPELAADAVLDAALEVADETAVAVPLGTVEVVP
jgi:hypothetical protein